jgi:phage tail-like protein
MTPQTSSRYLEYLPAIYHQQAFLGEFLKPFEEVLSGFEELLDSIDHYFAPALTDPEFLPWLATWVALVLDEEWDESKRRRLISEAVELYRRRGTVRGLKQYLEIYAGLVPEIREWSWPGGMQIGVTSRIGWVEPDHGPLTRIEAVTRQQDLQYSSYYVVDTLDAEGQPRKLYYKTTDVERVVVNDDGTVDLWLFSPGGPSVLVHHSPATITRRDRLLDDLYELTVVGEEGPETVEYRGDTRLVDEIELPYRFVVDVRVPLTDLDSVKLDKVRAIVDLEKPAHTMYYLKLTPVAGRFALEPMQIGFRSSVGRDTILG